MDRKLKELGFETILSISYDVSRDLVPVAMMGITPSILVVPASSPIRSAAELVAQARANPGAMTFANSGVGATNHLAAELFQQVAAIRLTSIPYRGAAQALIDLMAGQVHAMLDVPAVVAPSGTPRAVAERINAEVNRALAQGLQQELAGWGIEPRPMTPDQLGAFIGPEIRKWKTVAATARISVD